MIGYHKILIGHFITSYEILRYPTISFWFIPDAAHWNIRGIVFIQSGTIWGISVGNNNRDTIVGSRKWTYFEYFWYRW